MKILASTPYNYNKNINSHKQNKAQASFGLNPTKAIGNAVTDGLAYGFGYVGSTKPAQKLIDFLKDTNYQRHLSAFVGVVLSSFYMIDTAKSKKIEKDQKMPLIMNQGTVCALSTAGAYTLDKWLDKKLANFADTIAIANISDPKFQQAMIKYHANKDNIEVFQETAKVLKTQEQVVNKRVLDVFDNKEELQKLQEQLKGNKYAQKLFNQLKESENPKQILKDNYAKTDLVEKHLTERFQLNQKDVKSLEKLIKDGKADDTVKEVVKNIKNIAKEEKDKVGKSTEIFMNNLKNSPILQKMFAKSRFQACLDVIGDTDSKYSIRTKGFKFAKSMMVFAMIYRFVSPVFATPIANSFSSWIEENKKAKQTA